MEYRVDCADNRQQLRDWTTVAADSPLDIQLTPDDNESVITTKAVEVHEVTVRAEYGGTQQITGKYRYEVENLRFMV